MPSPETPSLASPSLETAAERLAALLTGAGTGLRDPTLASLAFEDAIVPKPLSRLDPPTDIWAVDGGQGTVADARSVALLVTRAARVRFRGGACVLEEEGDLRAHLLGGAEERLAALSGLRLEGVGADTSVDVNLLRDRWEWEAVERSVEEADPDAVVLVDGDLQPDWRIPSAFLSGLLARARHRGVLVAGVTKHSSLSRGGAPLVGQLEMEAVETLGARALWWAPVARSRATERPDVAGLQVVVARLDPDARFAFRIDLPADAHAEEALGRTTPPSPATRTPSAWPTAWPPAPAGCARRPGSSSTSFSNGPAWPPR